MELEWDGGAYFLSFHGVLLGMALMHTVTNDTMSCASSSLVSMTIHYTHDT